MQKVKLNTGTVNKGTVIEGSDLKLVLGQLMMNSKHHAP
jgi:hypothetical protein